MQIKSTGFHVMSNTDLPKYHQNKLLISKTELIPYCSKGERYLGGLKAYPKGEGQRPNWEFYKVVFFFGRSCLRLVFHMGLSRNEKGSDLDNNKIQ